MTEILKQPEVSEPTSFFSTTRMVLREFLNRDFMVGEIVATNSYIYSSGIIPVVITAGGVCE